MDIPVEDIRQIPIFTSSSQQMAACLAKAVTLVTYPRGTLLYEQGSPPTGLYIIKSGYVTLFRQSQKSSQILAIVRPTQCLGGESLPSNLPSPYTAKAVSTVQAFYITPNQLSILLKEHPDFLVAFLEIMTSRLRQLAKLVHDLAFRSVASRLAGVLLNLAETDGNMTADGWLVPHILSRKNLAEATGTAREVVHRTLKQFEQDGLIRQLGQAFIILDPDTLIDIAAEEAR